MRRVTFAGGAPAGWLVALLLVPAPGCAHRPEGPGGTVAAFGAAVARGDFRGAYALTSSDYQKRTPYEAFAAGLAGDVNGAKSFGQRLVAEAPKVPARAEVALDLGETLPLVVENGRWRIDAPGFEMWGQGTPRAALRTFVRALDHRRYDVLLRLVPNRYRGDLTEAKLRQYWEVERREPGRALLTRLRIAATAPIAESGDEAHLPYGNDQEVRFVREDGLWKIDDPQ